MAIRLDDGVGFVHLAVVDSADNPLSGLQVFGEFVSAIGERCVDGPTTATRTVVGAFGVA